MIATAIRTPSTTASPATRPASTRRSEPGPRRPPSLIRPRPSGGGALPHEAVDVVEALGPPDHDQRVVGAEHLVGVGGGERAGPAQNGDLSGPGASRDAPG